MSRKELGQWARLSAKIYQDPDFLTCSKDARLCYLTGIAIAKDLNQDGRVHMWALVGAMYGVMESHEVELVAAELVDRGLWSSEGGGTYFVRAFLKWNESSDEQSDARNRKRLGALKTNHRRGLHVQNVDDCPLCAADEPVSPGQRGGAIAPASAALSARRQETETGDVDERYISPASSGEPEPDADEETPPMASPTYERPEVMDLCELLATRIEHYVGGSRPKITLKWKKDMDLLLRRGPSGIDTPEPLTAVKVHNTINAVFDDLAEPNDNGFCWAKNVQSSSALRKHWVQMGLEQRRLKGISVGGPPDPPLPTVIHDDMCCDGTGLLPTDDGMAQCRGVRTVSA